MLRRVTLYLVVIAGKSSSVWQNKLRPVCSILWNSPFATRGPWILNSRKSSLSDLAYPPERKPRAQGAARPRNSGIFAALWSLIAWGETKAKAPSTETVTSGWSGSTCVWRRQRRGKGKNASERRSSGVAGQVRLLRMLVGILFVRSLAASSRPETCWDSFQSEKRIGWPLKQTRKIKTKQMRSWHSGKAFKAVKN